MISGRSQRLASTMSVKPLGWLSRHRVNIRHDAHELQRLLYTPKADIGRGPSTSAYAKGGHAGQRNGPAKLCV